MKALWLLLEQALLLFASWTLGFHVCLALSAPARWTYALPLLFYAAGLAALRPDLRGALADLRRRRGAVAATLLLSVLLGALSLTASRPDADDIGVYHRPLNQLERMDEPILMEDTEHDRPGLPIYSIMVGLASYEALFAYNSRWLGLDPLWLCQHGGGLVAALLFPAVYVLLYQSLGLRRRSALGCTWAAAAFLLLDGNVHFAFGHFAFLRMSAGKVMLIAVGLPLALLCLRRFWRQPDGRRSLHLLLCGVCAVGLSGSGLFLLPLLVLAASGAWALSGRLRTRRLGLAAAANLASLYPLAFVLAIGTGLLSAPADTTVWDHWSDAWGPNLMRVFEGPRVLLRDALILVALPLASLRAPAWRFLLLYSLALVLGFANPLLGPWVMDQVRSGAYWRLAFLFPLPLCAGLVFDCLARWQSRPGALPRLGAAAAALLASALAFEHATLADTTWKAPSAYRFPAAELAFGEAAGAELPRGARVLAPTPVENVLGLLRPDLRFVASTWTSTLHVFRNAGRDEEGLLRIAAMGFVERGDSVPDARRGFAAALSRGLDYVVTQPPRLDAVREALAENGRSARERLRRDGYVLLEVLP